MSSESENGGYRSEEEKQAAESFNNGDQNSSSAPEAQPQAESITQGQQPELSFSAREVAKWEESVAEWSQRQSSAQQELAKAQASGDKFQIEKSTLQLSRVQHGLKQSQGLLAKWQKSVETGTPPPATRISGPGGIASF